MRKLSKSLQKMLAENPTDKEWKKGDKGYVAYRYTQASCSAVRCIVTRNMDNRALLTVRIGAIWDAQNPTGGFEVMCYPFQVYKSQRKAIMVAKGIEEKHHDDDGEF
jgi:hypothetical protein